MTTPAPSSSAKSFSPPSPQLLARLLEVIENDIAPLTRAGVQQGNKIFGAAILRKSDLSLVLAETNNEMENPLWHGEMHAIKKLYERDRSQIPQPKDCIFLSTHEPCSLCLSAITWSGFDNFFYLFSHEDSRDSFNIPHDLNILREVFTLEPGGYNKANAYWSSYDVVREIGKLPPADQAGLRARVKRLEDLYADLSQIYQHGKGDNFIPLA